MKAKHVLNFLAILIVTTSSSYAIEYPKRKPGLWEIKTTSGKNTAQTIQQCIDEAVDLKMQELGKNMAGTKCTKNEGSQKGDAFVVESECSFAQTKISSHAEFTGDFDSKYQVTIQATYEPAMMGMKESTTLLQATYKGACAPGQKPGDMILAGGKTMNILNMEEMARKMVSK